MLAYANVIVEREWPAMRRGALDFELAFIGMDAIDATAAFTPANVAEANAQASTMQQLTIIHDARQRRIGVNRDGITWFEWLILIIGGVCIVCFCWLFGLRSERVHLLMTSTSSPSSCPLWCCCSNCNTRSSATSVSTRAPGNTLLLTFIKCKPDHSPT
jgi:hypothetical protein